MKSTRREFLITAGAAAASASIVGTSLIDAPAVNAATFTRRNVVNLNTSSSVLISYSKAITAMQALPTTNPLSWAYQAAIHGTTLPGSYTAWNTCTHGSYFFWAWHRMYLYWFERIIRKMAGDPTWALPFWDWTTNRTLPAPFQQGTTLGNLFTSNRHAAINNGSGSLPTGDVSYSTAFSFHDFTQASASLEGIPHGQVHVDVGGWMGSVPTAAQDPIFFLHHCNIDRLWNLWLAQGSRSDPLNDTTWKTTTFTFFDENGNPVTNKACDVLRAAAQLNYTYEGEPTQVAPNCLRLIIPWWIWKEIILINWPIPPIVLKGDIVRVPLDLSTISDKMLAAIRQPNTRVVLKLEGIEAPTNPGGSWEVYLGAPAGAALTTDNPAYLGNVVLFGSGIRSEIHHGTFTPASFTYPLNPKLVATLAQNPKSTLTFAPHGILINGKPSPPQMLAPITIKSVSMAVGTETEQKP
jgi:tyrosinase